MKGIIGKVPFYIANIVVLCSASANNRRVNQNKLGEGKVTTLYFKDAYNYNYMVGLLYNEDENKSDDWISINYHLDDDN
ncbi:hypothetical protein SAMN02745217_03180 [Anaerocolumna xylanovorans DSM 12503]|uniref:Uncharacterized protein n=1 Tax=Anaerocolumna xylanovorans DSM 12503 TaxID=1121345 RepID=A0A1M7YFJ9_9FIRM|nr:hypothetical protein SAMN02745217_03180 [Anaerocolumna xylanovorans DSM 12503]